MKKCIFLLILSTWISFPGIGISHQEQADREVYMDMYRHEVGLPNHQNYDPKTYDGGTQNWAIVQDHRGIMYFGNNEGVLEFDGLTWRKIPMPNASAVLSLAVGKDNRIYIGAEGEFGYLAPSPINQGGEMRYVSLLPYVNEEDRQFGNVRKTLATSKGLYFQTPERLFRWPENQYPDSMQLKNGKPSSSGENPLKVWRPANKFYLSFVVNDKFYVRDRNTGLMVMIEDSLQLTPDGQRFADQLVHVMLPYPGNTDSTASQRILTGTLRSGLLLYDGKSFRRFKTDPAVENFLRNNQLYHGAALREDLFALATLRGGVAVINQQGHLVEILNKASGLRDDFVLFTYPDRAGGLWLALNNGLARVETPSPFSVFEESLGVGSDVYAILRHQDLLYMATGFGVSYLPKVESLDAPPVFQPLPGIDTQSWSLLSTGKPLLAATSVGVYEIVAKQAKVVSDEGGAFALYRSKRDSTLVYAGLQDGLARLQLVKGKWKYSERFAGITENIRTIAEDESGAMWLGTLNQGVLRLDFPIKENNRSSQQTELKITRYGKANKLPDGWAGVYSINKQIVFATYKGLRRFDERTETFLPETAYGSAFADTTHRIEYLAGDHQGNLWAQIFYPGHSELGVAIPQEGGSYEWKFTILSRMGYFNKSVYAIYVENDGDNKPVAWLGGDEGIIRYNTNIFKDSVAEYPALVRRVIANGDSLIYGGAFPLIPIQRGSKQAPPFERGPGEMSPTLDYANNALRFEFVSPSYDDPLATRYQYFLEGFDNGWSEWNNETKKDYTNLPEGRYRFRVRARNVYQQLSEEGEFQFTILPPWYRTWGAYSLYVLLFGLGLFTVGRVQRQRLIKQERRRAQLRETELRAQTAEAQAKTLQAENERKKNVELLSEIGKAITATLSIEKIIDTVYENVNALMDATIFTIGIYNEERQRVDFPATKRKEKTLPAFSIKLDEENRPAIWCFKHRKEIFVNDYPNDYRKYIKKAPPVSGEDSKSFLYLPLMLKDKAIGVITAQSFQKQAYKDYQLNILRNMATYIAIALDNADAYRQLNVTLDNLKSTQEQLIVQEKLASLGQLTAGIAHEIKNPLNFVTNFAQLSVGLAEELWEELEAFKNKLDSETFTYIQEIMDDLKSNATRINEHGKRADAIVRSMLDHSRSQAGEWQETDINQLVDDYLNLAYHGMRARNTLFNVSIEKNYDEQVGNIPVIPQDISRVFLNIFNNAFDALSLSPNGSSQGKTNTASSKEKTTKISSPAVKETSEKQSPTLQVSTKNLRSRAEIRIRDNGCGIPKKILDQIFNPFFTTKPTGEGNTGLGLSISHDIVVKMHQGEIMVETEPGEFTEFIIRLPKNQNRK